MNGDTNSFDVLNVPYEYFKTFVSLDDINRRSSRPGSGPNGDYDYASRKDNAQSIQAVFYSGYMRAHGLKYQTFVLPNGMWGSVCGSSIRYTDKGVLNMSGLIEYLMGILSECKDCTQIEYLIYILYFSEPFIILTKMKKF